MGGERAPAAPSFESEPQGQREPVAAPAAPPPVRSAESAPPSGSGAGSDNKYVVWSSAPSDVQRSGPEDR
jgi:hypothetical protein